MKKSQFKYQGDSGAVRKPNVSTGSVKPLQKDGLLSKKSMNSPNSGEELGL